MIHGILFAGINQSIGAFFETYDPLVTPTCMSVAPLVGKVRCNPPVPLDVARWSEAAEVGRSTIFTFAFEPTVSADLPDKARIAVSKSGGKIDFVRLTVPVNEQERRLMEPNRSEFGKLRSLSLLRELHERFSASEAAMPAPVLTIDTSVIMPADAALLITQKLILEHYSI